MLVFLAENCVTDAHAGKACCYLRVRPARRFFLHGRLDVVSEPGFWTFGERNLLGSLFLDEDGNLHPAGVIAFDAAPVVLVWVT